MQQQVAEANKLEANAKSAETKSYPVFRPKKFVPVYYDDPKWSVSEDKDKIKPKWAPSDSENEEQPTYRKIRYGLSMSLFSFVNAIGGHLGQRSRKRIIKGETLHVPCNQSSLK